MSHIQQLPPEVKAYVHRRLREGASQAEMRHETASMLVEINEPPLSAAGLNRYTSKVERSDHPPLIGPVVEPILAAR